MCPRSLDVTRSELRGQTVVEHAPDSEQAELYRELARGGILHNDKKYVPAPPLESEELKVWAESWSDILLREREHVQQGEVKRSSIEGKRSSIEGRTLVSSEA